jgi:MFS-type transporter involved in bile tolerance (Atg22 family)
MRSRWMAAGAASFMALEVLGLGYAAALGRLSATSVTPSNVSAILMGMAVIGALFGLLFSYLHPRLPSWPIIQRAIVALTVFNAFVAMLLKGPAIVSSAEFWAGVAMSIVAGALFGWLGLQLGAAGEVREA